MLDVIKKLLFARQLSFEEGSVILLGVPIVMHPVGTLVSIRKILEERNEVVLLYKASKDSGKGYQLNIKKIFGMNHDKMIEWGINSLTLGGWGKTRIVRLNRDKKTAIIRLDDSAFAKAYGRSKEFVDDIFRGYAASTGDIIFNTDCDAVEVKCTAKGDGCCEFLVKPSENFDYKDENIRKQLSLPKEKTRKVKK